MLDMFSHAHTVTTISYPFGVLYGKHKKIIIGNINVHMSCAIQLLKTESEEQNPDGLGRGGRGGRG